jgi:glycosyltransferase involved in cell wall biosynthesis
MGTTIRIAYIGKMGHIQDFESLIVICRLLSAKVPVEVILVGGGERAEWLREELRKLPIKVSDHGYVWDQGRLADILTTADFGFNGYRLSAEVALSYKSMDYLSCGCALINSAKGDTWELVEQYRAGLNYAPGGTEATAAALLALSAEQRRVQRENALGLFREHFSLRVMNHAMDGVLEHIMRPNDA